MAGDSSIRENHISTQGKRTYVVRADTSDERDWLASAPVVPQLGFYRIAHCGLMDAVHPMKIVRSQLSGTFFLACFEGTGEVLIDGTWQEVSAGFACVQPRYINNAVRAKPTGTWKFCWARYAESAVSQGLVSIYSPTLRRFDPLPLKSAIEGLYCEARSGDSPGALLNWTGLVHHYVLSFVEPLRGDDRLQKVWSKVSRKLHHPWTLNEMAKIACVSVEHLRRLSTQSLGRTPMQHLTFLRLRRAADLLSTTDDKVSTIGRSVGYENQFAFSDMFQRWSGLRPTAFRQRTRRGENEGRK
ncbi:helix-turn-helix transcriptional regulator [Planctomicrobium sp. SH661]|uniref:helix-turn-helix transcriptional regulator n=1 Tax=Planctomicrobium sp. SH661 TaxID=3448124 RepID=UPI003F5BEFB1